MKRNESRCNVCGQKIRWINTTTVKQIACDPKMISILPDSGGDIAIVTFDGRIVRGKLAMKGTDTAEGYVMHIVTCKGKSR